MQADPIRAPARAQDLTLRHRVRHYRAGDLEVRYRRLAIEEDFFINYGFLPRAWHRRMHPRMARVEWPAERWKQAHEVLAFVRDRRVVHPREVDAHFAHGKTRNWFGGSSNASTQLLDGMHYRGMLRVARREGGTRCYAAHDAFRQPAPADVAGTLDALLDLAVAKYAPVPAPSLGWFASAIMRHAVPQWQGERAAMLARARARLPHARVDGIDWYWPVGESPPARRRPPDETLRLLAPFDPVVWDRYRFERFWGWAYRFEAYTPAPKRLRGYYALPLLWRDEAIGWANVMWRDGRLSPEFGFIAGKPPAELAFRRALDDELGRLMTFLQRRDGGADAD